MKEKLKKRELKGCTKQEMMVNKKITKYKKLKMSLFIYFKRRAVQYKTYKMGFNTRGERYKETLKEIEIEKKKKYSSHQWVCTVVQRYRYTLLKHTGHARKVSMHKWAILTIKSRPFCETKNLHVKDLMKSKCVLWLLFQVWLLGLRLSTV